VIHFISLDLDIVLVVFIRLDVDGDPAVDVYAILL
jgi:hypothetical protein